jgi:hypothetical protein
LQADGFQEAKHQCNQLPTPLASGSSGDLAMNDDWTECAFGIIIVWFDFWMSEKGEPV